MSIHESRSLREPQLETSDPPHLPLRTRLIQIVDQWLSLDNLPEDHRELLINKIEQVLVTAKLEALAEFAAGAGHEINNPVATIAGRAQLLLSVESDPERRHALEVIGGQALRIRDMIGDLMLFARPPRPQLARLELLPLAQTVRDSQSTLISQRQVDVDISITPDFALQADRTQVLVLLSSLLRNSLEATDRQGIKITMAARQESHIGREWSVLTVSDDGPGIPDSIREHLFDPFYSGRQAGRGLGFGLCKCWRIAQLHGGRIEVLPATGRGAAIEVWLPE